MVTPAAGPVIVCVPPVSLSSSWPPLSVIVWGVLNTVESKTIVFAWSSALAWLMQYRRSPASLEPLPASPRLLTVNVASSGAALEDLQDRAAAAVMVNRAGGECEPLFKSATAGHGCLLLESECPAIACDAMRCDSRDAAAHSRSPSPDEGPAQA